MSDDLVKRLREGRTAGSFLRWTVTTIHIEAAGRIEALEAEVRELCLQYLATAGQAQEALERAEKAEASANRLAAQVRCVVSGRYVFGSSMDLNDALDDYEARKAAL